MAITTTKNTRSQYFQEFTTSGTWTAPAGVNFVDVLAVGGGGGGGGGGCSTAPTHAAAAKSAGRGGGGGGGAEVVRRTLAVTPNTSYAVTVGAGGTGGQVGGSTATQLYNAFLDGEFNAGNINNWTVSAGTGTASYNAGGWFISGGNLNVSNTTDVTLQYDSTTGVSIPFSTVAGDPFVLSFSLYHTAGGAVAYGFTPSIAWYNGATLIRTDNMLPTGFITSINSGTYYAFAFPSTSTSYSWGATAQTSGIPATATRFILTLRVISNNNNSFQMDGFVLGSNRYIYPNFTGTSVSHYYLQPSTFSGLAWQGTTNASPILTVPFGSQWLSGTNGRRGASGSNGGTTSFGSLLSALGGGGGGGGSAAAEHQGSNTSHGIAMLMSTEYNAGYPQSGANGGGSGGYGFVSASNTGYNYAGGGGGGAGGYSFLAMNSNNTTPLTKGQLASYISAGTRGFGGSPANTGMVSSPFTSYNNGGYPILGADGLFGYAYGGNGGGGGGHITNNTDTAIRTGQYELNASSYLNAAGGLGGNSGGAGISGGAATAGSAGSNATIYGSGGGGGGGAGAPNATTSGGTTSASGQNGGAGGNGASGYVLISWWE